MLCLARFAPHPSWLVNGEFAVPAIAAFSSWKFMGFCVVLYLAALRNVPEEHLEAAHLDGAGPIRVFFSVTVPAVRHATALVTVLCVIGVANVFTEPYLMTYQGGPNGASTTPQLLSYLRMIQGPEVGYAAAIGVLMTSAVLLVSILGARFLGNG